MRSSRHHQAGFTLVEMIFVTVLISIIGIVVGRMLFEAFKNFQVSQRITEVDWRGLLTLERISADLMTVRSPNDISVASASQLTFVDVSGTSVNEQYSGTSLSRNSQTVSTGLSSFSFSYLDKNGATTSTPSAIRYVDITLNATQDTLTESFSTSVGLRFDN